MEYTLKNIRNSMDALKKADKALYKGDKDLAIKELCDAISINNRCLVSLFTKVEQFMNPSFVNPIPLSEITDDEKTPLIKVNLFGEEY